MTAKDESNLTKGKNCPVAVDLMNLKYVPLASQAKFHANNAKFRGFSGPVGSGKSKALAYEALYLSAISPNCMGYVTAPTHTMLQDAAQRAIFSMLQEEGIEYKYTGGEQDVITFMRGDPNFDATNGRLTPSQIKFRSTSNHDRLRGSNLAWFGMDELTYSDPEAWSILIQRIREPTANQHNGFGCWTPKGFDWVHKIFINEETRMKNSYVIRATPGENYYLESDYYSTAAAQYDERFARQELMGEYLSVFQGQVYHSYDPKENVTTDVRYVPGLPIAWSLDFNVDPFCSVLLQRVDGPHQSRAGVRLIKPWTEIWAFDEIVLHETNTFKMCEEFGKRTKPLLQLNRNRLVIEVYGDATGARRQTSAPFGSDHKIIQQWFLDHNSEYDLHWNINNQNPPIRARVNAVNAALCDAGGTHHLKINPNCAILMNDLQSVSWRKGDEGTTTDEGSKRELTHSSDALGYYIMSMSGYGQNLDYIRKRMDGF